MAAASLTEATFDEIVAGSDVPVLVEFWAGMVFAVPGPGAGTRQHRC
jgi:hypothetical protein